MSRLTEILYGSEQVELEFNVPAEKALENLQNKVAKTYLSRIEKESMVGSVSRKKVNIQRVVPDFHNSFRPVLVGSIESSGSTSRLSGAFRFNKFVQVFMTFWLTVVSLITLITVVAAVLKPGELWFLPLIGLLMLGLGIGVMKLGRWMSKGDTQWLKITILNAANGSE